MRNKQEKWTTEKTQNDERINGESTIAICFLFISAFSVSSWLIRAPLLFIVCVKKERNFNLLNKQEIAFEGGNAPKSSPLIFTPWPMLLNSNPSFIYVLKNPKNLPTLSFSADFKQNKINTNFAAAFSLIETDFKDTLIHLHRIVYVRRY